MSDLWSVGVVLYAMLCGYLPFEDQKTSDLYKKILSADYTLPDFLSPEA
jgi:serine/threonine protein kinase